MKALRLIAETARAIVGLSSYAAYRRHMSEHHPDAQPMSEVAFFRDRQRARYGGGAGRCC